MNLTARWLASLLFVCTSASQLFPQTARQNKPLPKDPAQFLQLAAQQNGLGGDDLKPWHVRATWQVLDDKGKPQKQGTWEEWWVEPHEKKVVYDSPDYQETGWTTAQGEFTLKDHGSRGWLEDLVEEMILYPVRTQKELGHVKLKAKQVREHRVVLDCVTSQDKSGNMVDDYCFDAGLTALRTRITPVLQITLNSIVQFQGRFLAKDIYVARVGMPAIEIRLDAIEELVPGAESQLAPPPQATFHARAIPLAAGIIAGYRRSGALPEYPANAKLQHVQGTVVLWAVIGKDGAIHNLEVIGGPPMLQQAAVDAVKTWQYQPYLLNGLPVEVETQIHVVYRLGGGNVTGIFRP